jgi:integrase
MGLYRRGKIWWISYMEPGVGQRFESTGTNNKRLACKILSIRKAEVVEGRYCHLIKSSVPTVDAWLTTYLDTKIDLHPNTRKRYECSKKNLQSFFTNSRLSDITEARIEEYKRYRLGKGMRAAGVNRDLSFLRLVLKQGKRERYIAHNPLDDSDLFLNERRERLQARPFTLEEEQRLLAVASGYLKPLILLLVDTGLRVGKEALPLRWNDLDLQDGAVYVRQSKTQAGVRSVPLTARLKAELVRWKRLTVKQSDFVFPYPVDPTKHLKKVPKTWARALKEAGVEYRRIYDLRATFASRLSGAGVPQVFVDQLMGHSGGLAQTYAKVDEFRRQAIGKLEAFVCSRSTESSPSPSSSVSRWIN